MFGIGFQELVLLSLIGLVVLGPERLPRVANQLGNWLGQARRMTRVMRRQLEDEVNFDKDFKIKPPNREPSTQPPPSVSQDDDTYSPAHEDGEPGSGVGDSDTFEDDDDLAVTTADRSVAETPAEPSAGDSAESGSEEVPATKDAP